VDDFQAAYKEGKERSTPVIVGNFTFELQVTMNDGNDKKSPSLYLKVSTASCSGVVNVCLSCTFTATQGDQQLENSSMEADYQLSKKKPSYTWGQNSFSSTVAQALHGKVIFSVSVFVERVEIKEGPEDDSSYSGSTLLCARLADLQDELTSSINTLYSNSFFFSVGFHKSLARELQGSRGGVGLPGNIASHVPVGVLRKLRTKLPAPIAEYRNKVLEECTSTAEAIIGKYVVMECHPKLHSVLVECAEELFNAQASELEHYHEKILEWEENVCSSNHYFMDTVNSIRTSVYETDNEEKPLYLRHLTAEAIAAMSNEDQKLVDQQIELFAYWKLMKKRLVDYVLLSTQGELVNAPIHMKLKQKMLEAVFCRDDVELVELMSPDSHIVKTRANVVSRLEKLNEAMKEIDEYKAKHPGGLVEIA